MKRIAHILDGKIANVSIAPDDWTPVDGQILESEALAQGLQLSNSDLQRKTWTTSHDFIRAIGPFRWSAILQCTAPGVPYLVDLLRTWHGEVWSDNQDIQNGFALLVQAGAITEADKNEILAS